MDEEDLKALDEALWNGDADTVWELVGDGDLAEYI